MTAAPPLPLESENAPHSAPFIRMSDDELRTHARFLGIETELLDVQEINAPDCVTVKIGKPDGRTLRRVVPRECWNDARYRNSLIRDMGLLLA